MGIYSRKEMNAVLSYIMYVMNKMELFHNIQLHQVFVPTLYIVASHHRPNLSEIEGVIS